MLRLLKCATRKCFHMIFTKQFVSFSTSFVRQIRYILGQNVFSTQRGIVAVLCDSVDFSMQLCFQGICFIGLWRGSLLFLVERWIVSFLFVDFLVQSIKSSPDNCHKLVFPTVATYVASSGSVKQDPTLDQPHLSQAWQALSSGDGLPDQIGLETYIYDEVGEWKAHKWDYA